MTDPRLDRRAFLRGLGGLTLAGAAGGVLAACGGAPTPEVAGAATGTDPGDDRLRVGYLPITDATPLLVAHGRGLYAANDLQVERPTLLRSWSQVAEAFQSRQVDVVHLLMPMAVQLRFDAEVPLKVVAWNHTDGSALTVAKQVSTLGDLAGTTVAVPFWHSIHNVAVQLLLADAGLTPILEGEPDASGGQVKLVVMAPPDMPPALANGAIAGYIVADPFNAVAEVQDIGHVLRFTGDVWKQHACCVTVMHEDALVERPEWSQRVVDSIVEAALFARTERLETARLLSKEGEGYLPQPGPAVERALTHFDHDEYTASGALTHPEWGSPRIDFQPFPFASYTEELVRRTQATLVDGDRAFLDALDPAAAHADLVDDRFTRNAIERVGGPAVFDLPASLTREEVLDVGA